MPATHREKKNGGRMDITSELAEGGEGSLEQIKTTTKEYSVKKYTVKKVDGKLRQPEGM
jgi:hypothetical protein